MCQIESKQITAFAAFADVQKMSQTESKPVKISQITQNYSNSVKLSRIEPKRVKMSQSN